VSQRKDPARAGEANDSVAWRWGVDWRAPLGRRGFLAVGLTGVAAALAQACGQEATPPGGGFQRNGGHLTARPGTPTGNATPGLDALGLSAGRDGLLYVPANYSPDQPAPLVLLLHGAGGSADGGLNLLYDLADAANLILLAVDSRDVTWDVIRWGGFGPDVVFIDAALELVFDRCAVDPARIAVAGFSDGATYSLSLGLTNGDLFSHLVAFSPGYYVVEQARGKPPIFIRHGIRDQILDIDQCSRRIVPALRNAGYTVNYQEFDGPHTVTAEEAAAAVQWLACDQCTAR
jgi:phospholipase/carboxylesterase